MGDNYGYMVLGSLGGLFENLNIDLKTNDTVWNVNTLFVMSIMYPTWKVKQCFKTPSYCLKF